MGSRAAARAAERRRRFWFNVASWATTIAIVLGVGAIVHWRVTTVLRDDGRAEQAEAELARVLRDYRQSPEGRESVAARLRAIIAKYPDTPAARKAREELARMEEAGDR